MSADNVLGWEIVLKISHLASKLRFSAKCSFFGQSPSRGHYQPTYQPPEGVYLLNNRNPQLLNCQKIYTLLGVLWNVWPWSSDYAMLSFGVLWYLKCMNMEPRDAAFALFGVLLLSTCLQARMANLYNLHCIYRLHDLNIQQALWGYELQIRRVPLIHFSICCTVVFCGKRPRCVIAFLQRKCLLVVFTAGLAYGNSFVTIGAYKGGFPLSRNFYVRTDVKFYWLYVRK